MKTLLVVLALLAVPAVVAQPSPQRALRLPTWNLPADKINLLGIAAMGGERYAALSFTSGPGGWMKAGQTIGRFKIASVDENSVKLVDSENNAEFTKPLGDGKVKDAEKPEEPARYSRAWINSKANPMLYHTMPMPSDIAMNWSKLTEKEREEIIAYYRQHGWQLLYTETNNGITSGFSWNNIYENERRAVMKANNAAFDASLNVEQLAYWKEIRVTPVIRFNGREPTPDDLAEIQRRKDRVKAFQATLSPEQLAAFKARGDFTMHDWTKE